MTTLVHPPQPDYESIKARQQATWASGDYGRIGATLQIVGESLCEAVDLRSGDTVLDVAAGNGNASLAAARRFARVTSVDYVPALLDQAGRRAQAEGLSLGTMPADAEDLPFGDGAFDVTLSTFGVMFSPDSMRAAMEMVRVTKPGGRIGLANWTPEGFIGRLFRLVGGFVPPPAGLAPPTAWGTAERLEELFRPHATDIRITHNTFAFRYRSAEHWVEAFRAWYGPMLRAFAALDEDGRRRLHEALLELLRTHDRGDSRGLVVPSEYLEVVILRT